VAGFAASPFVFVSLLLYVPAKVSYSIRHCVLYALLVDFICYAIPYHSTKGVGATAPDFSKTRELEDGLIVPMGKPKRNTGRKICTICK
jgi:hypothetical protein